MVYWGLENKDTDKNDNDQVTIKGSHIYFYSEFTRPMCLELNNKITELDYKLQVQALDLDLDTLPTITLHINSYGGYVDACMSSIDTIIDTKCDVHTIVEGVAASCGTLMSVVGNKRSIKSNAKMLIHQLSGGASGKYADLKDDMINTEGTMEQIRMIYRKYSKVPNKELEEILSHDLWWDAEKCLKMGLVDEII